MMTPEYLAGFFDGEGCINITVHGKIRQVVLRIYIANTNEAILREIQATFGGYVHIRAKANKCGWKPFGRIIWQGSTATRRLLKITGPHLRLKRRQLELALEFLSFMELPRTIRCERRSGPTGRVFMQRRPETLVKELEFKLRMHALNRKGIHDAELGSNEKMEVRNAA